MIPNLEIREGEKVKSTYLERMQFIIFGDGVMRLISGVEQTLLPGVNRVCVVLDLDVRSLLSLLHRTVVGTVRI